MSKAANVTVVFLSRGIPNGVEAFRRFISSYDDCPAELDHRLLVILKGWRVVEHMEEVRLEVNARNGVCVEMPDDGFDLGAYFRVAEQIETEWVCFLNTHTRIQSPGWLRKMYAAAAEPMIVAIGATGSWESGLTNATRAFRNAGGRSILRRLVAIAFALIWFKPFPNPHVRSNVLLTKVSVFRVFASSARIPRAKRWAHVLESGRVGFSASLLRKGYKLRIVDADGYNYAPNQWRGSGLFRGDGRSRLLAVDNQTELFERSSDAERRFLREAAWGKIE